MTFDQLMTHATQIEDLATRWAVVQSKQGLGDQGPPSVTQVYAGSPEYGREYEYYRPQFAGISSLFAPFSSCPDPAQFPPLIQDLDKAVAQLAWGSNPQDPLSQKPYAANKDLDSMSGASSALEDWTGLAAQEFKEKFIDPFPSIERNHFLLVQVLESTLGAEWAIWVATRHDIDDIAHKTLAALDHMEDCGRNTWGQSFTVAACLAGIAAAPFTGGVSLGLNLVGAAAWVMAASPPQSGATIEFSGESPAAVVQAMTDAISKLKQEIQSQRSRIDKCLTDAQNLLSGDSKDFVFPRPALAGTPGKKLTGKELTSSTGLGYVP